MSLDGTCMSCDFLGDCSDTNLKKLAEGGGCGSWKKSREETIVARVRARDVVGTAALKAMLTKDPPKKPVRVTNRR